jgi:hypothetical protein
MPNDDDEIQVWRVSPDEDGKNNRIVFDDSDEAIQYAHEVLDALWNRLGSEDDEDCEILTIEQTRMTRGEWRAIQKKSEENDDE